MYGAFRMTVDDVFAIRRRGVVATGVVESGELRVGDEVVVNGATALTVAAIESYRKKVDVAQPGDTVGLLFSDTAAGQVSSGDVLTAYSVI